MAMCLMQTDRKSISRMEKLLSASASSSALIEATIQGKELYRQRRTCTENFRLLFLQLVPKARGLQHQVRFPDNRSVQSRIPPSADIVTKTAGAVSNTICHIFPRHLPNNELVVDEPNKRTAFPWYMSRAAFC